MGDRYPRERELLAEHDRHDDAAARQGLPTVAQLERERYSTFAAAFAELYPPLDYLGRTAADRERERHAARRRRQTSQEVSPLE